MHAKSIELILYFKRFFFRPCLIVVFLSFAQPVHAISIEEYNQRIASQKWEDYIQFQTLWMSFLKGDSLTIPPNAQPAWARKATEEYLSLSGPLKAAFANASKKNTYSLTLKRPEDEQKRPAAFHRTHKSIFIDANQTSSSQWLLFFVHEVAHSLDSELFDSLEIYNNENFVKNLAKLGKANQSLKEMSAADRQNLDEWLMAGLNRGFLAEYRAWTLTYLIYEEGLADGTFQPVAWLEEIKNSRSAQLSIEEHILRYLSPSWEDPTEGIFSFPFIQQALTELRQKIYANPGLVKMGAIGDLIQTKKQPGS